MSKKGSRVAAALSIARRVKRADGGEVSYDPMTGLRIGADTERTEPEAAPNRYARATIQSIAGMPKAMLWDAPRELGEAVERMPMPGAERTPETEAAMQDAAGQSFMTAVGTAGASMPFAKPGAAGIFGGKLAQTADHAALARAEELSAKGVDQRAIFNDTGWFQGADGQWRFEIPDENAKFARVHGRGTIDNWPFDRAHETSVGTAFEHPDLYAAYPDLKDTSLAFEPMQNLNGYYRRPGTETPGDLIPPPDEKVALNVRGSRYGADKDQSRSTMLHELQHAVQTREGFVPGSSTQAMQPVVQAGQDARVLSMMKTDGLPPEQAIETFRRINGRDPHPAAQMLVEQLTPEQLAKIETDPYEAYRRVAGEVEARNVQARRDFNPVQRTKPPWVTEDIPREKQLIGAPHDPAAPPLAADVVPQPGAAADPGAVGSGGGGPGGNASLPEAQAAAARWAGERQPLEGLPGPLKIGDAHFVPGPIGKVHDVAEAYMREHHPDRPYTPPTKYHPIDPEHSQAIAKAYEEMAHTPNDPATKASYEALIDETAKQYQAIKKTGLKIEPIKPGMDDPYAANPRLAAKDVAENNHLWFFPTESGFGTVNKISDNPMLRNTGEKIGDHPLLANDMFRIVHDYFGHLKEGHGFRAAGEDNAWRTHSAMYSDIARPAMTTETRGQNSNVNYSNKPLHSVIGEARARELYGDEGRAAGAESSPPQRGGVSHGESVPGVQSMARHDGSVLQSKEPELGELRSARDNGASADASSARLSGRHGTASDIEASGRPLSEQQRPLRAGERAVGDAAREPSKSGSQHDADLRWQESSDVGVGREDRNIPAHAVGSDQQVRLDRGAGADAAKREPHWKTITVGEHNRRANAADTIYADQKVGLMPEWTMRDRNSAAPIMVYHGTPHSFGRFDYSRIGAGEGNQAYGHGLYFAGHEPVSEWYRHQLATRQDPLLDKYKLQEVGHVIGSHLSDVGGDPAKLAAKYAEQLDKLRSSSVQDKMTQNMIDEYGRRIDYLNNPQRATGHMYQVGMEVNPDNLLDYDASFANQTPHVQGRTGPMLEQSIAEQKAAIERLLDKGGTGTPGSRMFRPFTSFKRQNLEGNLLMLQQAGPAPFKGSEIYQRAGMPAGNPNEGAVKASQRLRGMDIPGLRYKDAGSRAPGQQGSHNYVMFGDDMLKILRKYGVVGIPAAGVLGADGEERRAMGGKVSRAMKLARKLKRASGGAAFGVLSPAEQAEVDDVAPMAIGRSPDDSPVLFKTADPRFGITQQDFDRGLAVGLNAATVGGKGAGPVRRLVDDTGAAMTIARKAKRYAEPEYTEGGSRIINKGVENPPDPSVQTVADPHRMMYPGVYRNPRIIAEEAAARVGEEDPAMQRLFGVTRGDLREMAKGRVGNEDPRLRLSQTRAARSARRTSRPRRTPSGCRTSWPRPDATRGCAPRMRGTSWTRCTGAWSSCTARRRPKRYKPPQHPDRHGLARLGRDDRDPARHRRALAQRTGPLRRLPEICRRAGGDALEPRFPQDMRYIGGHPYHRTSQGEPMAKYLEAGSIQSKAPKVPLYVHASGVPETGFQTSGPVGDAHFRAASACPTPARARPTCRARSRRSEYQTLQPWWQHEVAGQVGLESVPAQARLWTALGPQTGVESERWARRNWSCCRSRSWRRRGACGCRRRPRATWCCRARPAPACSRAASWRPARSRRCASIMRPAARSPMRSASRATSSVQPGARSMSAPSSGTLVDGRTRFRWKFRMDHT
jgi:hypothetical protein